MATAITPLGRRVLVKRSTSEEKTAGGIFPDGDLNQMLDLGASNVEIEVQK